MSQQLQWDLLRLLQAVGEDLAAGAQQAITDGTVEAVEGNYANVRIGVNEAGTPDFYVPPSLEVRKGDHVLVYRPPGWQQVLMVLQRNALNLSGAVLEHAHLPTPHGHSTEEDGGLHLMPQALSLHLGVVDVLLEADTHNLAEARLARASQLRVALSGPVVLTGIEAQPGRLLALSNISAHSLTLAHEDGNSLTPNRLAVAGGADYLLEAGGMVLLLYDEVDMRWRVGAPAANPTRMLQTVRHNVGSVGASSSVLVEVAWPEAFPSTAYTVQLGVQEENTGLGSGSMQVTLQNTNLAVGGFRARVTNSTTSARTAILHALGVHD